MYHSFQNFLAIKILFMRMCGVNRTVSAQLPKWRRETQLCKERFRLIYGLASPFRFTPVWTVPGIGEPPRLIQRQRRSARKFPILAPLFDVLFVPEEQHRLSVEDYIVPPTSRRNREMNQSRSFSKLVLFYRRLHSGSATTTRCFYSGVLVEHRRNSHRVPNAVAIIGSISSPHEKGSRHSRERISHKNFSAIFLQN